MDPAAERVLFDRGLLLATLTAGPLTAAADLARVACTCRFFASVVLREDTRGEHPLSSFADDMFGDYDNVWNVAASQAASSLETSCAAAFMRAEQLPDSWVLVEECFPTFPPSSSQSCCAHVSVTVHGGAQRGWVGAAPLLHARAAQIRVKSGERGDGRLCSERRILRRRLRVDAHQRHARLLRRKRVQHGPDGAAGAAPGRGPVHDDERVSTGACKH
jgi:hypothetical protein